VRRSALVWTVGLVLVAGLGALATMAVRDAKHDLAGNRSPGAVEIGFAQDMAVHHQQAVLMATYTREHAGSRDVRLLAATIDSAQQREIGQMVGWLQSWGRPVAPERPPMAWMDGHDMASMHRGSGSPMPGMATLAEMDELVNLKGRALDVLFLQLMTRHHQGGLPMAKYAATHARVEYVRDAARSMILDQQREIDQMTMMLESRGARPRPFAGN
jgi:uncharacterized protein (DUF305 family)